MTQSSAPIAPLERVLEIDKTVFFYLADGQLTLWAETAQIALSLSALSWLAAFARGASIRAVASMMGTEPEGPPLGWIRQLEKRGILVPVEGRGERESSTNVAKAGAIECAPLGEDQTSFVVPMDARMRLPRAQLLVLTPSGQLTLWCAQASAFYEIDPSMLAWLMAFHRPSTALEIEAEIGRAFDTADRALLDALAKSGVLLLVARPRPQMAAEPRDPAAPARARIAALVDAGSFVEDGRGAQGTITGTAMVGGRTVAIVAYASWGDQRFTSLQAPLKKVLRMQETAMRLRCPILYLLGDGGPSEAGPTLDTFLGKESWGRVYHNMVVLSGLAPQLGIIFGTCSMPSSFPPALCDALILVDKAAFLSIAPPSSVKRWLGEEVDRESLGGAGMHCRVSGMGDFLVKTEEEAIDRLRSVLSYLPSHCGAEPPYAEPRPAVEGQRRLEAIIPSSADQPFDMMEVVAAIADRDSVLELKRDYAKEMITALARLDGRPVGVIANNSRHRGGILFPESCEKEARFVSLCDAYGIPLLFLVDCPGYMIGSAVEKSGLLRATARIYTAIVEATVPKITVVVRKAHTGGVYAMCGPFFNPDHFLALPSARIAILGAKALYEGLSGAEKALPPGRARAEFREHLDARCQRDMNPYPLAPQLAVDGILGFDELRPSLIARFDRLRGGDHGSGRRLAKKHAVLQM